MIFVDKKISLILNNFMLTLYLYCIFVCYRMIRAQDYLSKIQRMEGSRDWELSVMERHAALHRV